MLPVTAIVALNLIWSIFGASTATAASDTLPAINGTITYACTFGGISTPFQISFSAASPSSVAPGGKIVMTALATKIVIPAKVVDLIGPTGPAPPHIGGTVSTLDFRASNARPASTNAATPTKAWTFKVPYKAKTAATVMVPSPHGTVGPLVAGKSGTVVIVPSTVDISIRSSSGTFAFTCTPPKTIPAAVTVKISIK